MISKHKGLFDSNYVVIVFWIVISKMRQYVDFNICLVIELLLISDDFKRYILFCFMVKTFQSLPKTSFSQWRNHFKSVPDMVFEDYVIVSSFIVISIVKFIPNRCIDFLCIWTNKVNFFEV